MSEQKKDEIRVEDRRHFDRDGNVVRTGDTPAESSNSAGDKGAAGGPTAGTEKIDFVSILFSYVHTALIYLGDLEDPLQHKTSENLEGARQMIDILELMQQKTRGNLTQEETQYLESALYDLRMRYMTKAKLIK